MTTIAVDAMGGDYAPTEIVYGAYLASKEDGIRIQLVGPEGLLKKELDKYSGSEYLPIDLISASEVIDMGETQPAIAVRKKPNSSIVVAMNQVAQGKAGGVVAAGSTGAAASAAFLSLKRIEGIERPCIAALIPTHSRPVVLADAGANVETTPEQLYQNALMAISLSKGLFKLDNPKVALLNIGEEPGKGNALVKEAYDLFKNNGKVNFIGNVEAREVPEGVCDVCVCDGFVGNVFLKTAEGMAKLVTSLLREELTKDIKGKLGALLAKDSFYRMKKRIDYSEYGGAQLLGVKGVCVIAHGSSRHIAIKNAIRVAKNAVDANIISIIESMSKTYVKDKDLKDILVQKNYGVKFLSFASALPKRIVKNTDLEKLFNTSDEWIYTRTGIKQRRVVDNDESGLSLSVQASKEALKKANIKPEDIDLIIVATATPDKLYPSMSCLLQGELGAKNAFAFDLSAACSGFVYGIVTASQFIYSGEYKNVLLVGVDIHSRFVDWSERSVAVLFGDGAGAVVMSSCLARDEQLLGHLLFSEADKKCDLVLDNSNILYPDCKKEITPSFVRMNGKVIYQFAVRVVPDVINRLLDKISLKTNQVDYFVLHQANQRIIDHIIDKLGLSKNQVISNIEKVGNTSSASIPLAIVDALVEKKIKTPCKMMLVGFGAGLTWGAVAIHWK